eukprot:8943646-Pyramimonas_sp.AAC.1
MTHGGSWYTLSDHAEFRSMQMYVLLARMAASACELLVVRHRWWPRKTFATLRDDNHLQDLLGAR